VTAAPASGVLQRSDSPVAGRRAGESRIPTWRNFMSRLYIISTPIGNLGDLTHRAATVLGEVARVLAEDTRRTSILLRHYGIATPLQSLNAHNEAGRTAGILARLEEGEDLALVSDAGTPLISDPGARIVRSVLEAGHEVVPIPGASAVLAALVAGGLEPEPFTYYGFLPRSGRGRRERLAEVAALRHTAVLFEAPHRLRRLLAELAEACGAERPAVVARELTKVHETFFRGTIGAAAAYYEEEEPRGEVVVLVGGAGGAGAPGAEDGAGDADAAAKATAAELVTGGERPSAVARELVRRHGLTRNRAYEIALAAAEGS
jgi:16S rRNA (cytidine1402-2'-O)-methyltransferase